MTKQQTIKEQVEVHLRFAGPDVDDGSMSVEDIIPVLQGFSGAYAKIASTGDPDANHNIRITGVRSGSADIVLEVVRQLSENGEALASVQAAGVDLGTCVSGASWVVDKLLEVIRAKRHARNKPCQVKVGSNNGIVMSNCQKVEITLQREAYDWFVSGRLDSDLSRMMRPLEDGRIDSAKLSVTSDGEEQSAETVSADERQFFDAENEIAATTEETELVVKINSVTKSTKSGWVYLPDNNRVFFRYVGDAPEKLYRLFSHKGPVKIRCKVSLDENLRPSQLEVFDLQKTQEDLFPSDEPDGPPDNSEPTE